MKTLFTLVCASLLAGCTSATMQEALTPTDQSFGYPRIQSVPLPAPAAPAPRAARPSGPVAAVAAPAPAIAAVPQTMAVAPAAETEAYDEKRDPAIRELLAQATRPVEDELRMTDGKLVLPAAPQLDIIDIHDATGALKGASATPSS